MRDDPRVPEVPPPVYDDIGRTYTSTRREDPRIASTIHACLGSGRSVLNVGAGTGSYEPADRFVVGVEPSVEMLRQRPKARAPVLRAVAEALPVADLAFDVAMAVLTMHHWRDVDGGLRELRRVSRRQVVLFFEPLHSHGFWAVEYFPEAVQTRSERNAPGEAALRRVLRVREIRPVLVPHDCIDGFGAAYFGRPEAYLRPEVQAGMSWLALLEPDARQRGTERLAADLASGGWDRKHGALRDTEWFDGGYRIAIAD
jgi:SAM-dependent methyltransferase